MRRARAEVFDAIGFVEAAYRLDRDLEDWLAKLAECAAPDFPGHTSVAAYELRLKLDPAGDSVELGAFATLGGERFGRARAAQVLTTIPPPLIRPMFLFGPRAGSMADLAARGVLPRAALQRAGDAFGELGREAFWARALDLERSVSLHVGATFDALRPTPAAQLETWRRLAAHLAASYRLRRALEREGCVEVGADPLAGADGAILTPAGEAVEARGGARARSALDRLRASVVRRERARTRIRIDAPVEALELWPALSAGRWSLVDCFESDGRRFVVARVNEEGVGDPRRLTPAEQRVARLLARGLANKEIAYDLGLSTSRAGTLVASICRKLGARSRVAAIGLLRTLCS